LEIKGKYHLHDITPKQERRNIILIDFDATINRYNSGWDNAKGGAVWIPDAPIARAKEAIEELRYEYKIVIFTTRAKTNEGMKAVRDWLTANAIHCDRITYQKEPASMIIDDRAICFRGNWFETLAEIKGFKPWTKWQSKSIMTVLVGNIGTGKSSHARTYEDAVIVCMDSIIISVEGSYNYRNEHRTIYHAIENTAIEMALKTNVNVVVDRTCMTRKERARFIDMAKRYHAKVECVDFGSGDEESLENRINSDDDRDYTQEKWREVHEIMQEKYEEPDLDEGFETIEDKTTGVVRPIITMIL